LAAAHFSKVNCGKMLDDRPKQFAYKSFSIKRDFSTFKKACARKRQIGVSLQKRLFYWYWLV